MKKITVRLLKDTEKHKAGQAALIVGNPGRGMMSAYELEFEDGTREFVPPLPGTMFEVVYDE